MKFCTILHSLQSPQNVGMIVRSHVAHGGKELILLGHKLPWEFKKRSQSFSRKLEKQAEIIHIRTDPEFFAWAKEREYKIIAIEINENSKPLDKFNFPDNCAIVVGNEANGLSKEFMSRCDDIVTIPQYGEVGSLNVAVSASIVMYELNRETETKLTINDNIFTLNGESHQDYFSS